MNVNWFVISMCICLYYASQVTTQDFQYMEKIGRGAFGYVIHAVKLSTGKHYAMKIQRKKKMLAMYSEVPHRGMLCSVFYAIICW